MIEADTDKKNFKPASLQVRIFLAFAICLFFFTHDAFARGKQTGFSKKQFTEKTQFDISYSNQAKQSYTLTFLLNNHILRQAGIPKYDKLQRLIRDDTLASANLAAKKSRTVLDDKYQQAHNRVKNFTERANQDLAPWYQIILTRTGVKAILACVRYRTNRLRLSIFGKPHPWLLICKRQLILNQKFKRLFAPKIKSLARGLLLVW